MGLNDEAYSTIRSQILAMDPLPSLDRIFNITQQEEKHKQVVINRDQRGDSAMAFVVNRRWWRKELARSAGDSVMRNHPTTR